MIHGLVHASVLMLPPLLGDLQRAFRVSLLELLAVANAMYLVYGLAAIPAGFLADRFGSRAHAGRRRRRLQRCRCCWWPPRPASRCWPAGLVLLGLSAGVYHPSGLSLLSRGVAPASAAGPSASTAPAGTSARPWPPPGPACSPPRWAGASGSWPRRCCRWPARCWPWACPASRRRRPAPIRRAPHAHAAPRLQATLRALGRTLRGFAGNRPLLLLLFSLVASGFVYRGFLTFLPLHLADAGRDGAAAPRT